MSQDDSSCYEAHRAKPTYQCYTEHKNEFNLTYDSYLLKSRFSVTSHINI